MNKEERRRLSIERDEDKAFWDGLLLVGIVISMVIAVLSLILS